MVKLAQTDWEQPFILLSQRGQVFVDSRHQLLPPEVQHFWVNISDQFFCCRLSLPYLFHRHPLCVFQYGQNRSKLVQHKGLYEHQLLVSIFCCLRGEGFHHVVHPGVLVASTLAWEACNDSVCTSSLGTLHVQGVSEQEICPSETYTSWLSSTLSKKLTVA